VEFLSLELIDYILLQINNASSARLQMKVEGRKERNLDFSREILEARAMIRENNYLSLSNGVHLQ
jgi:FtsZ-binding cell division protein ZapB